MSLENAVLHSTFLVEKKTPPEIETLNASDDRGKTKFNVYQNPCFSQGDDTLSGQEV